MLFTVCSAVTVECCVLYPCCVGVFGMFAVMYERRLFSNVFAITERRDMALYEVPLSMSLLGFGMGTMLANFHMPMRNASPRGPMCFRCLMFNLSGPCELLFFYYLLDLSCGECYVMSFYVMCCSVAISVCLMCCVFVNCNMIWCGCYFIVECYGCV